MRSTAVIQQYRPPKCPTVCDLRTNPTVAKQPASVTSFDTYFVVPSQVLVTQHVLDLVDQSCLELTCFFAILRQAVVLFGRQGHLDASQAGSRRSAFLE